MSDFFDDENLAQEEQTSAKEEKKKVKKKKLLPKVIAAFLSVAILIGGTVAVIKLIPEKEDDTSDTSGFKTIEVLSLETDDIGSVSVTNPNNTFTFKSEVQTSEESESETKTWYLDGVSKELQDSSSVSAIVTGLANISAIRTITEKTAEECGLSQPKNYAEITKENGEKISVNLGDASFDNSGYYLTVSTSSDIFLVESSITSSFDFDELTFASTESIPAVDSTNLDKYFTDGTLSTFDSLTVSGKNFATPLVIVPNKEGAISEYIPYKITSPDEHYADSIDDLLAFFQSGITVSGAYSYDTSEGALTKFGLNTPDLTVSMKLGSKEYKTSFSLQDDGDYAAVSNVGKLVYKVSADTVSTIANGDATRYYSSIICLFSIDKLKTFTIGAEGKSYEFSIKKIEDEDSEDGYEIKLDGKKIDCQSFQNLYQYILSLGCFDYTTGDTDKTDTVSLVFNLDGEDPATVNFERSSDTKYQYSFNGKPIGKIQSSKIDKLVKYTKKLVNGEKISELN